MSFDLFKETTGPFHHGHTSVGTSAIRVVPQDLDLKKGLQIKSAAGNTGVVYLGRSNVTANSNAQTGGYPLQPGESIAIPIDEAKQIYVIASQVSQDVAWMGI